MASAFPRLKILAWTKLSCPATALPLLGSLDSTHISGDSQNAIPDGTGRNPKSVGVNRIKSQGVQVRSLLSFSRFHIVRKRWLHSACCCAPLPASSVGCLVLVLI